MEGEGEGASGKDLTAPGFLAFLSRYVVARRSKWKIKLQLLPNASSMRLLVNCRVADMWIVFREEL